MQKRLSDCKPGTRFLVKELGIEGTLIMVNECRAYVKKHQGKKQVAFGDKSFVADKSATDNWTPSLVVQVLEEVSETGDRGSGNVQWWEDEI